MGEEYGMKVYLELVVKNAKNIERELQEKLGKVNIKSISDKARAFQGAVSKGGDIGGAASGAMSLGKIAGTAAIAVGAVLVIAEGVKRIVSKLTESSPYLKGILSIFQRSFMYFMKPFGDFLGTLLRPLAIMFLRLASNWLRFSRTDAGQAVVKGISNASTMGLTGAIDGFQNFVKEIQEGGPTIKAGFESLKGIGTWLWEKIIAIWDWNKDVAGWLWEKVKGIWDWSYDVGGWLWEKIQGIWAWNQDMGTWLWGEIQKIWNWAAENDFGKFLWDKLKSLWNWAAENDFASWVWDKLKSVWSWNPVWDFGKWLWDKIKDAIHIGKIKIGSGENDEGNARGLNFVPETGMYKLHRGEQVLNSSRAGSGLSSLVFTPTINLYATGNSSASDLESSARRLNRIFELELRSKGLV